MLEKGPVKASQRPKPQILRNLAERLTAGSDVKMPTATTSFYANALEHYNLPKAIAEGEIDRGAVRASVRRVLKHMAHLD